VSVRAERAAWKSSLSGVWVAGDFGHRQILLSSVCAAALPRGITEILFAFSLRHADVR